MNLTSFVAIAFIVGMAAIAISFLFVARRLLVNALNADHAQHAQQTNAANVYIIRGYARRDAGDVAGAIVDFKKALKLQPDHQEGEAVRETLTQLEQTRRQT